MSPVDRARLAKGRPATDETGTEENARNLPLAEGGESSEVRATFTRLKLNFGYGLAAALTVAACCATAPAITNASAGNAMASATQAAFMASG